jgi:hypothetical protein
MWAEDHNKFKAARMEKERLKLGFKRDMFLEKRSKNNYFDEKLSSAFGEFYADSEQLKMC